MKQYLIKSRMQDVCDNRSVWLMTQLKNLTESFFSIKDVGFFSGKEASPILFCFVFSFTFLKRLEEALMKGLVTYSFLLSHSSHPWRFNKLKFFSSSTSTLYSNKNKIVGHNYSVKHRLECFLIQFKLVQHQKVCNVKSR
jgi:hypothetical protein